jgi:hypothetical protein
VIYNDDDAAAAVETDMLLLLVKQDSRKVQIPKLLRYWSL